ncbi:MAG TPA: hypothetical protein VGB50_07815 [Flavobacterium sp.]
MKVSGDFKWLINLTGGRRDLCESLLLSVKEVREGFTVQQLIRKFQIKEIPEPQSLTNYQARIWYSWKKSQIETLIKRIPKLEDKARKAFELRNEYRSATRIYMKDVKWAEYLKEVEKNRTWEEFLSVMKEKYPESYFKTIIKKSLMGREKIDDLFKIKY